MKYYKLSPDDVAPYGTDHFAEDEQKMNLFWLVEPRLDTEGLACLLDSPCMESIDHHMDEETSAALELSPMEFMRYWEKLDDGSLALTVGWPPNYRQIMRKRASGSARLGREGNVIRVNFRKTA